MELENQLLEALSLKDLLDLSKIKLSGTDLGTGKRDVSLTDPLEYKTYSLEDVPLPEGTEVIVEGSPLNQQEIVVQTDQPTGFGRFLAGLRDIVSGNKYDYDRRDEIPLKEFQEKNIAEKRRRADIENDRAIPTLRDWEEGEDYRRASDEYEFEKMKIQRDEQLRYMMAAIPGLAEVLNDEIYKQRMRIELNSPSEILGRINKSRTNYVDALRGRAEAQERIANATAMGLGRYSGIRNVAA